MNWSNYGVEDESSIYLLDWQLIPHQEESHPTIIAHNYPPFAISKDKPPSQTF
jgi:hypothetical protein